MAKSSKSSKTAKPAKAAKAEKAAKPAKTETAPETAAPAAAAPTAKKPRACTNVATALRPDERKALEAHAAKVGRSVSSVLREAAMKVSGFKFVERGPGRPARES